MSQHLTEQAVNSILFNLDILDDRRCQEWLAGEYRYITEIAERALELKKRAEAHVREVA